MSPTITSPALVSGVGVLLGTAAYMAPEQAKGRPADKRSDVWAFGCVLFEMLTGKRAFEGDDVADTLAAVLRGEPDWSTLPPDTPTHVLAILKRCVEKDRKNRIADLSAVRFVTDHASVLAPPPIAVDPAVTNQATTSRSVWVWKAAAALLTLTTVAGAAAWWIASRTPAPTTTRFFVYPPEKTAFVTYARNVPSVAISPDGTKLAFTAKDAAGKVVLWIRPVDSLTAQPLPNTDDAAFPFWSPDSQFIAYFAQKKLLKISASGGPPQLLCVTGENGNRGGSWSRTGTIIFSGPAKTLSRVSSAGGQPSEFMHLTNGQNYLTSPWFLPDGQHFLFYAVGSPDAAGVYVASLDTPQAQRIVDAYTAAVYDSQGGHLLFLRGGTLFAQRFDTVMLKVTGESFPVAERVDGGGYPGIAGFSVSTNGKLAYGVGAAISSGVQMAWLDRQGKQSELVAPLANYRGLDLAPDGKRIVAHRHDGTGGDIWVTDISRGTTSRFTFDASQENSSPIWSPDGNRIAYASFRDGKSGLYQKAANNTGAEERLIDSTDALLVPDSWSPDGKSIVYEAITRETGTDLWMLPLTGDRKTSALLHTRFNEGRGQVSPDGKWLAYFSNETGRNEVYIQPFPSGTGKWQISTAGGTDPRWRSDSMELFYLTGVTGGKMMAVDIRSKGATLEAGSPKELFDSPLLNLLHTGTGAGAGPYHAWAVSANGQRFLIPRAPSNDTADTAMPIAVVENWAAALMK